ncbi:MAG: hypothetical protein ACQEU4_13760 [Bacillota bacterium]
MPTTKKENLYFGMMMCVGMVVVMTFYNLVINKMLGTIPFTGILVQLILGFIVALLLELFIVGPVAHKMVFSLPFDKSKSLYVILFTSLFMVVGMVCMMSLFGLGMTYFFEGPGESTLVENYISIASKNFIFALPLQLVIMGPFIRFVFAKFVKGQGMAESVH